jgi:hypothetical protein
VRTIELLANEMRRYVTYPKAHADLHGGRFFWHTYRRILEIEDDGSARMLTEVLSSGTEQPATIPVFTGLVADRPGPDQMAIHLTRPASDKKLTFLAIEAGDDLICTVYSEFNESSESELFRRD